jgi:hypothetical protein
MYLKFVPRYRSALVAVDGGHLKADGGGIADILTN